VELEKNGRRSPTYPCGHQKVANDEGVQESKCPRCRVKKIQKVRNEERKALPYYLKNDQVWPK
jgi:hypothetical protein